MTDAFDPTAGPKPESGPPTGSRGPASEPVWTYRGYQLRAGEFTTAMVHFFRAEMQRANVWRQRLDTTTNWAVITTGAVISFAFSRAGGHHGVILLNILLVTLFLYIEARRYRYYELWSYRVRLMETDFYATMLVPPFHPAPDWAESLAENLLHPEFPISLWEALGRRFRRNYLWIYLILDFAWVVKVASDPSTVTSVAEFAARAGVSVVPGWTVIAFGVAFNAVLLAMGLFTIGLQKASGEVLPRFGAGHVAGATPPGGRAPAWFRPSRRRRQLVALIVSDCDECAERIAKRVLAEMNRGLTALPGVGMYTRESHLVLMCALTVTEVNQLKTVVSAEDPKAFVVVIPAHEVLGFGFMPLGEEK
jgi:uncharacterized membrane protein